MQKRSVLLKCSQTAKKIAARVEQLSKEDLEPLTLSDLQKGSSFIVEVKGKPYPAEFLSFSGEKEKAKGDREPARHQNSTQAP